MRDGDPLEDTRDALYDAYVEAALAGRAVPPDAYLSERDVEDDELRARLEAVHRAAERARGATRADGDLPFERLGPYRVLRRLDEGGMGMVYLGAEERLGRLVALKVLRPELQGLATQSARFEREAQVVARLRHPHIVTIFGVGEERGMRFLAMEYVEGEGLDEVIARSREERHAVPVATAVRWAIQVAGALQAAHEVGVVHRDVKPSNIRIGPDGNAVLLDFGIAAEEGSSRLTVEGSFLGTAAYSAPEQLRPVEGIEADGRADVYSLGVVLYELLTGVQPFDGTVQVDTAERVLRSDVTPARKLRHGLPRDLETVLQAAMEREPQRRYASADALAQDLRAVLEVRPIEARRPGPLRRTWKLARRHPVAAIAILFGVLAIAGTFVAEDVRNRANARDALDEARQGVLRYRQACEGARAAEHRLRKLDDLVASRYMTPKQDAELAAALKAVHDSRRGREAGFHDVLARLRRAERLDPDLEGIEDVRAALYVERWREARTVHDDDAAVFYRQLALDLAPEGDLADQLHGTGTVTVRCATPGASARIFRWERLSEIDPDGEPRLVPLPVVGASSLRPGAWAFRLLRDHDGYRAGDLIVHVAGEEVADANWRDLRDRLTSGAPVEGLRREAPLPLVHVIRPGAEVRVTTQPLEWVPDGEALAPAVVECPSGPLLVVVRAPGHEERREVFGIATGQHVELAIDLHPEGTTPPGFVHIGAMNVANPRHFWLQEREVTAAEYLEFLNDPATLAEIDASDTPTRVPRSGAGATAILRWPRGDDGRFAPPGDWPADWPAVGLSFDDAQAYCAWWNRRAAARGEPWRAALPTLEEWTYAGSPGSARSFVYGNRFHPKWANGCYSRPIARIEPVMTYPRDESVHGAFDLSGSAWEWTDSWWDEGLGLRRVSGGSWARAPAEFFRVWGGQGYAPETAMDENGFRLVLRRGETDAE